MILGLGLFFHILLGLGRALDHPFTLRNPYITAYNVNVTPVRSLENRNTIPIESLYSPYSVHIYIYISLDIVLVVGPICTSTKIKPPGGR